MLLKQKIKEGLRATFSPNYIHSVRFDEAINMVGPNAIRNFIQIGSNDGATNDPIHESISKYGWPGILVEPDAFNFEKLVNNYKGRDNLHFEKLGIGPESGVWNFYRIDRIQADEPAWFNQIGSFDKGTFINVAGVVDGLLDRMVVEKIPVITFERLLNKYGINEVGLLHIDTEGYDYRILRSIDFSKHKIRIVFFETEWMTQHELRETISYLRGYGYKIYSHISDHMIYSHISDHIALLT